MIITAGRHFSTFHDAVLDPHRIAEYDFEQLFDDPGEELLLGQVKLHTYLSRGRTWEVYAGTAVFHHGRCLPTGEGRDEGDVVGSGRISPYTQLTRYTTYPRRERWSAGEEAGVGSGPARISGFPPHDLSVCENGRCDKVYQRRIALKFCDPERAQSLRGSPVAETVAAVAREAALYTTTLADLQGSAVPRFFGLWRATNLHTGGELYAMMLEDVGSSMRDVGMEIWGLVPYIDTIRHLYASLHNAGVVHNDVSLRHICLRARTLGSACSKRFCLIDFEDSSSCAEDGESKWEGELGVEQHTIAKMLANAVRVAAARRSMFRGCSGTDEDESDQ